MTQITTQDRYRGSLLGLAVGDAVGTTLEFTKPGTFEPINDMIGGGPFRLQPGQWTDDTSMALCLATSLVEKGFDPADQMRRYVNWYKHGYLSSNGVCFDIGNATRSALLSFLNTTDPFSGSTDPYSAGNGSIMRLAPVPMLYRQNIKAAMTRAAQSSRTTHGAAAAVDGCRAFTVYLVKALSGMSKYQVVSTNWTYGELVPEIMEVVRGSYKRKKPPEIQGSGYVVKSLEAALWAFLFSKSFEEGCLMAANLGDDADTTAAVFGQLAGAFYGEQGIPQHWLDRVTMYDEIRDLADQLYERSEKTRII